MSYFWPATRLMVPEFSLTAQSFQSSTSRLPFTHSLTPSSVSV